MREIKFRVRNLEENKFEDLSDVIINIDGAGCEIYKYNGSELYSYELNQYTGLKDTNGKEIYEGDIVKVEDDICLVEYKNYGFGATSKEYDEYCLFGEDDMLNTYVFEVIGNIYEDKHLLEEE